MKLIQKCFRNFENKTNESKIEKPMNMLIFFRACICVKVLISIDQENNHTLNLDTTLNFAKTDLKNRKLFWNLDYDNNRFRLRTGRKYLKITGDNILDFSDGSDEMEDYDENEKINELREVIRQDEDKGRGNGSRKSNNSRSQDSPRGSNSSRGHSISRSRGNTNTYGKNSSPAPRRGPFASRDTANQENEGYNDPIIPKNRGSLASLSNLSSELVGDSDNEINSGLFELQNAFNMNSNTASGLREEDDDNTSIAKKLESDTRPKIETANKTKKPKKSELKDKQDVVEDGKSSNPAKPPAGTNGGDGSKHSDLESKLAEDAPKHPNVESKLSGLESSSKSNTLPESSKKSFATRQRQPKPGRGFIFKLIPIFNNKLEKKMLVLAGALCLTHDLEFRNCDFNNYWDLERDFYWDIYRADDLSIMDKVLKTLKSKSKNNEKIKSAAYVDVKRCSSTCPEGNCDSDDEGHSSDQSSNNTQYNQQTTNPPIPAMGCTRAQPQSMPPAQNYIRRSPLRQQAPNKINTNMQGLNNKLVTITEDLFRELSRAYKEGR